MHTVKDAIEHIFNLMIGKEDSDKVRTTEIDLGRFGLSVNNSRKRSRSGRRCRETGAPSRLTTDEISNANTRISCISIPSHDFTPGPIFSRTFGLKSHDWKEVWLYVYASTIPT